MLDTDMLDADMLDTDMPMQTISRPLMNEIMKLIRIETSFINGFVVVDLKYNFIYQVSWYFKNIKKLRRNSLYFLTENMISGHFRDYLQAL